MMDEMDNVFEMAKRKAVSKIGYKGYSADPWNNLSKEFLERRLTEEFSEYMVSKDKQELLDIINIAAFISLTPQDKCRCPCVYCAAGCRHEQEAIDQLDRPNAPIQNTCNCKCCGGDSE